MVWRERVEQATGARDPGSSPSAPRWRRASASAAAGARADAGRRHTVAPLRAPRGTLLKRRWPGPGGVASAYLPCPSHSTLTPLMAETPSGDTITMDGGALRVPDRPIIPFIEGDGIGPDIWAAAIARARRRRREGLWRRAPDRLEGDPGGREGARAKPASGCPRPRSTPSASTSRRHQGAAHDARRRRHPLAQRGAAPEARPLRLRAAGALLRPASRRRSRRPKTSTWSSSARTRRTSTRASSSSTAPTTPSASSRS